MVLTVGDGELSTGSVQLELWAGGFWQPLATNDPNTGTQFEFSIAPTQSPKTIQSRVRYADTANTNQGNNWYSLKVGKRIANIDHLTPLSSHSGGGTIINANVASRQFYNQWEWGGSN